MSGEHNVESFSIDGEMTIFAATELRRRLAEACGSETELRLDLASVTEVDTAGIQLLEAVRRDLASNGGRLIVFSPSAAVVDALRLLGATDTFDIADSEGE